ncbi:MAG: DNA-directed RNA polymerase subunit B [Nanoarchaeota archaeon]|nr:DNA-directed RNA polymerase subunit B [Nanoarchaeota archaeon]|tara:strand:+ start:226 stop:2028 length:1803 start_codon:yes stop_codon:yes gene_type:complete
MTDVYLDERYVGKVENAEDFIKKIVEDRRAEKIPNTLNIHYNEEFDEVTIDTSNGRARRPLVIVRDGKSLLTKEHVEKIKKDEISWDDLIKQGVIEYLDAAEEENTFVALEEKDLTNEHTHMEIAPITILGLTTSLVPYGNFDAASKLNGGSKNQKHALGIYVTNFLLRMDTDVSILHYPQKPLVKSFMHDISSYDTHPSGQNVVIAEMCYDGYNMEDAIVVNKSSIERGMSRSTYFRPYNAEELRYSGGLIDEIGMPDKEIKGYRSEDDYKLLESDGVVYPGAKVKANDVIIGKTSPPRFLGEMEEFSFAANVRRESSVVIRQGEGGVVDMVVVTENGEGNKLVQVRLRDERVPEVGDKFTSRHGQKGVIGLTIGQVDLPFSGGGVVPDILHSPHSIPSRMTVSHMIEILAGKAGALNGKEIDGSTFDAEPERNLRDTLFENGFRDSGMETMYNGITGERYKVRIYIGNMYYLKLKHMVANKLHARASGRIQLLTRQPIEGRSKGGGLRLGEMEKDCFVAHGASLLLKERFDSDKTIIHICESCGMLAINDLFRKRQYCTRCGDNVEITPIELSYAFKLLLDELRSLGIHPKLVLRSKY